MVESNFAVFLEHRLATTGAFFPFLAFLACPTCSLALIWRVLMLELNSVLPVIKAHLAFANWCILLEMQIILVLNYKLSHCESNHVEQRQGVDNSPFFIWDPFYNKEAYWVSLS